ncbi:hypothetical protein [Thalassospira tepidiphila]|uniref:hypothetical protein n=1 Tax=Thalassospira tepidiphila TaxID=393657 RepID=UPI003AA86F42
MLRQTEGRYEKLNPNHGFAYQSAQKKGRTMNSSMDIQGSAALSICESTLICLADLGILSTEDITGILEDARDAHNPASAGTSSQTDHQAVHRLIDRIIKGGNALKLK